MTVIPPRTVAHDVLTVVRGYGVDTAFGIPGTHNIELYRPLQGLGFRVVTTRHEQGAGFAADGWAQTTGLPGVVLTTSGPGLLNVLSAAATSWGESRPMLILSPGGSRVADHGRIGALHETKDPVGAASSVLSWSRRVNTADEAIETIHEAFAFFRLSRPGPVHVELPIDLLALSSSLDPALLAPRDAEPVAQAEEDIAAAAQIIAGASRPVILAGGGAIRARSVVRALAERIQAPVVTTVNGKGILDESHPLAVGSDIRVASVQRLVNEADVLIVLGSDIGEAELWSGRIEPTGQVVRIDIDPEQISVNVTPTVGLVGDVAVVLPVLVSRLPDSDRSATATSSTASTEVAALREAVRDEIRAQHLALSRIVDEIVRALPSDAIVAGDSSQVTYLATSTLWPAERPNQLLYMPTYATLGYGLPAAIGAKVAAPKRAVVGIIGDGALMFSIQEFVTAVEQQLSLPIVCVDNGGYGEIRQNMIDAGMPPTAVRLTQPDWPALARALGGAGFEADLDTLAQTVGDALALDVPSIIHVRIAEECSADPASVLS